MEKHRGVAAAQPRGLCKGWTRASGSSHGLCIRPSEHHLPLSRGGTGSLSCSPRLAWRAPTPEHRDLAAMGTAQVKENPSNPAPLRGRLVPGQGSPQPMSPPGRAEPTAAPRAPLARRPSPTWQRCHAGQKSRAARGPWRHREEPEAARKSRQHLPSRCWSTSATQLPVGEQAARGACSVSVSLQLRQNL